LRNLFATHVVKSKSILLFELAESTVLIPNASTKQTEGSKMRGTLIGTIAALALGSVSSAAVAADMAVPEPAPVMSWTGFYLGGGGGIGWADLDLNARHCKRLKADEPKPPYGEYPQVADVIVDPPVVDSGAFECDPDFDFKRDFNEDGDGEFVGVVQGGFDYEIVPSFVFGVFASWEFTDIGHDNGFDDDTIGDEFDGRHRFENNLDGILTVAGRAGFAPTQNLLLYGLFGWSWADIENNWRFRHVDNSDFDFNRGDDFNANGFTFGGGAEWRFTENLSIRAEYRFTDFDNFDDNNRFIDSDENEFRRNFEVDLDVQRVLFTLNWRFGGFGAATAAAY
jgi:outer membrane immunogenic protein